MSDSGRGREAYLLRKGEQRGSEWLGATLVVALVVMSASCRDDTASGPDAQPAPTAPKPGTQPTGEPAC